MGTHRAARMLRAASVLAFSIVVAGPARAEGPLEGSWMLQKADKSLDPGTMITIKVDKRTVSLSALGTISYTARVDGPDVPIEGDINIKAVSIKMPAKNVLVETAKSDGKPWQTTQYEAAADGRTMQVTWKNHKTNKTGGYTMGRQ